ncbi:hypothetical protein AXA44_02750 [Rhodococcus sp. SC4]|nr:hypothetical protein AXA44_02750 [Rhodococcus sp. SC4]
MTDQPFIDSARLQFSGLSAEDFEDIPEIGEQRTYTILATCQAHNERAMANEGTRKSVNMKVVRVLSGVTDKINEQPESEPTLYDEPVPVPDEDDADEDDGLGDTDEDGATVHEFTGPSFSAGDE